VQNVIFQQYLTGGMVTGTHPISWGQGWLPRTWKQPLWAKFANFLTPCT